MRLDDAVDHRQAKPRPLADLLGGEERVERLIADDRRHSRAVVLDLHEEVIARRDRLGERGRRFGERHRAEPKEEPAELRDVRFAVDGVARPPLGRTSFGEWHRGR